MFSPQVLNIERWMETIRLERVYLKLKWSQVGTNTCFRELTDKLVHLIHLASILRLEKQHREMFAVKRTKAVQSCNAESFRKFMRLGNTPI